LKERPQLVQRFVAAMAESVYFVENPDKTKAALSKVLKISAVFSTNMGLRAPLAWCLEIVS
jgi:ABC-type nitrate/sulfonate/bicarbonate transport system substrate-binding protein